MTTAELASQTHIGLIRQEFRQQDVVIADMKEKYTGMTVAKDGFKTVKAARIEVKNLRCSVENRRKELKADVLERGKIIDEEATRLKNLLTPIEKALEAEEEAEENRKAAEARAKVEAEERRLQIRIDEITALGVTPDVKALKTMDEDEYFAFRDEKLADYIQRKAAEEVAKAEAARIAAEAEAARLAQIEADRIERERLAALHAEEMARQAEELRIREAELAEERAKIEAQRAVEEAERRERERIEQDRIAAERAKLDAERAELARQQEEARRIQEEREREETRLEAIRRKRIQDEEEAENLRLWNEEQARLAAEEAKRLEALKPEIELAELFGVRVRTYCEEWFGDRDNRAWFGFADAEIEAACARIVEHVRES